MAELLNREGLVVQTALGRRPKSLLCNFGLTDSVRFESARHDGPEVIRNLRSNPACRHVYSVILTGLSQAEIRTFSEEA